MGVLFCFVEFYVVVVDGCFGVVEIVDFGVVLVVVY